MSALFTEDRHETVCASPWDPARAHAAIQWIAKQTEAECSPQGFWATHPLDAKDPAPQYCLYFGACGVIWALRFLEAQGAVRLSKNYEALVAPLIEPNQEAMGHAPGTPFGSYMMGDTGIRLLEYGMHPSARLASELADLIHANIHHPARELMWGSPGTLLAALFLHRRTGEQRWAQLFRETAGVLWSQLEGSAEEGCHFWTQDLYGQRSSYIDAVHGFVATASPLIQGRNLMEAVDWASWKDCIANTITKTAEREGPLVNWRARLSTPRGGAKLMQYCHGAPGFAICLADFPDDSLDGLLIAAGESTWTAGPLRKGSNLCHGTGGNGYVFLKLYRRTGDAKWLERARAFAMHGIAQTERAYAEYGHLRHSLWTGDPGFAIYLWHCLHAGDRFPTLDVFFT
ncbi:MAG: LanC-like protein [Ramlibacter sp.]